MERRNPAVDPLAQRLLHHREPAVVVLVAQAVRVEQVGVVAHLAAVGLVVRGEVAELVVVQRAAVVAAHPVAAV